MPTSQNRQSKSSDNGIKPQDQVVDVTPLNSTAQLKIRLIQKQLLRLKVYLMFLEWVGHLEAH